MINDTSVFPFVDAAVADNGRLEMARMVLPGIVRNERDLAQFVVRARKATVHGQRHSQGGQTLMDGATSIDLDLMQAVEIAGAACGDLAPPVAIVQAGATWDRLHHALVEYKGCGEGAHFAPMTHQSSPFFSVGGSLAVNCHGRDPQQGPVADSVLALKIMKADGSTVLLERDGDEMSRRLMSTVLGGYGAGALILEAHLQLKNEVKLNLAPKSANPDWPLSSYCGWLMGGDGPLLNPNVRHHYAWLSCGEQESLFQNIDAWVGVADPGAPGGDLSDDTLLSNDILSAIYQRYRLSSPAEIGKLWPTLIGQIRMLDTPLGGRVKREINAMRAPVRFTQSQPYGLAGGLKFVDLMQEYFVPPAQLMNFTNAARDLLAAAQAKGVLKLLSSTVRFLQRDTTSLLNYAPDGPRCSLVINFGTPLDLARGFDQDGNALTVLMRKLIDLAHECGGAYYPCYGRFATGEQFKAVFGVDRVVEFIHRRRELDPYKHFTNKFLETYLSF